MTKLPETPARKVLRALLRAGFEERRRQGSHRFLVHQDGRKLVFAFHEGERLGHKILSKLLKDAGLSLDEFRRLL